MAFLVVSGRVVYAGVLSVDVLVVLVGGGVAEAVETMVCGSGRKNWKDLSSSSRVSWILFGLILLVMQMYLMCSSRLFTGTFTLVAFTPEVRTNA